jgi:hypothetical protein
MISLAVVNLVTPKAGAKHEHLFNELALGRQNRSTYSRRSLLQQRRRRRRSAVGRHRALPHRRAWRQGFVDVLGRNVRPERDAFAGTARSQMRRKSFPGRQRI